MWDPYERDVATLEKAQRRAARFVKGDHKRESCVKQMTCDLGWQKLEARKAVSRLSLMYKITHGLTDVETQILVRSWRATRESQGQHYFRYTEYFRASFFSRTVPEWNHPHILLTALSLPLCETSDINDLISKSHYDD